MAALQAHFRAPASRQFGKALGALAAEPPALEIHEAAEAKPVG